MNVNSCKNSGFEDLIVSYIYDEASGDERRRLETHILECSSCMEDFAGMSNARLSVFEWQKESFSGLETPVFTLPKPLKAAARTELGSPSFVDRLGSLIAGLRGPAVAFATVLILLVGGIGYVLLTRDAPAEPQIVANVPTAEPAKPQDIRPAPAVDLVAGTPTKPEGPVEVAQPEPKAEPAKAVAQVKRVRPARSLTAKADKPSRVAPANRRAPVLSDFDDTVDTSLRLSDLFDSGVGSIKY